MNIKLFLAYDHVWFKSYKNNQLSSCKMQVHQYTTVVNFRLCPGLREHQSSSGVSSATLTFPNLDSVPWERFKSGSGWQLLYTEKIMRRLWTITCYIWYSANDTNYQGRSQIICKTVVQKNPDIFSRNVHNTIINWSITTAF